MQFLFVWLSVHDTIFDLVKLVCTVLQKVQVAIKYIKS